MYGRVVFSAIYEVVMASSSATCRFGSFLMLGMSSGLGYSAIWHSLALSFCRRTLLSVAIARIKASLGGAPRKYSVLALKRTCASLA
ncbi:hypothetical protein D3C78_1222020 [compost metagenome]